MLYNNGGSSARAQQQEEVPYVARPDLLQLRKRRLQQDQQEKAFTSQKF
jgi:hypothetical protein